MVMRNIGTGSRNGILRNTLALALAVGAAACSGTPAAFGSKYPDNRDHDIELMLQRINAAPQRKPGTIAAGVTVAPVNLYAYDVAARKQLWQRPVQALSAPYLAGDAVVVQTNTAIVGFDLRTGAERFSVSRGAMTLKGADGEGGLVAFVIGQGQGTIAKSEAILVEGGSVRWRRPIDGLVGVPAVVGNMVLVPWSTQFVSAIDAQSGEEFARVRVHDGVISHAISDAGQIYVGSFHGITRITSSIGSGTLKGSGYFSLPERELPGRPLLLDDLYTSTSSTPPPDSAQHRIALAWRPIADRLRIGLQDNTLYLVFYRFVYALDPRDESVRWVYVHDADVVGAAAQAHGVAIADEAGRFTFLGAGSGEVMWKSEPGPRTTVVRLPGDGGLVDHDGTPADPNALPARLLAAAQDQDARLVPARLFAVSALASLPQADATADLIQLCDSTRLAPPVRERACVELKQRSVGADHLLATLERHAGYLEGTTAPPVGPLAKAAASLKEKRAVPMLIAQLKDPNTPSADLLAVVNALGELGDASAAEPLGGFLRMYHADPIDEHLVRALEAVPAALLKLSGPVAQPVLEKVTYDELGSFSVRQKARIALDTLKEQQAAAERQDEAREQQQEQEVTQAVQETGNPDKFAPPGLTMELVAQALLPVRDQLLACLKAQPKPTFQARTLLVVEDGKVLMVSVLPGELQSCLEPLIKAQPFPKTKSAKREQISYVIKR
jgi:outer membrane protein assembly factor BamB